MVQPIVLGYKTVQHVTVQNNMKLNQAQEKIKHSGDSGKIYAPDVTQHTVLQKTFF